MTGRIDNTAGLLTRLAKITSLEQAPGRCIASSAQGGCTECTSACPWSIPTPRGESLLNPEAAERCTRCGACVTACPTGALEQSDTSFMLTVRAIDAATGDALRLRCSRCDGSPTDVVIGCLRGIGSDMLLRAVARGALSVDVVTAACSECADGVLGLNDCADAAVRADGMLRTLGSPARVTHETGPFVDRPVAGRHSRREFFETLRDGGASLLRGMVQDATQNPTSIVPHERGTRTASRARRIAVTAVEIIAAGMDFRAEIPLPYAGPGPLCHQGPDIDRAACMACGDCAHFCPTGAMRISVREGEWRLSWSARRCVGCGVCASLCRTKAISMRDRGLGGLVRPKRLVFYRAASQVCETCGATFPSPNAHESRDGIRNSLCPACRRAADRFPGLG